MCCPYFLECVAFCWSMVSLLWSLSMKPYFPSPRNYHLPKVRWIGREGAGIDLVFACPCPLQAGIWSVLSLHESCVWFLGQDHTILETGLWTLNQPGKDSKAALLFPRGYLLHGLLQLWYLNKLPWISLENCCRMHFCIDFETGYAYCNKMEVRVSLATVTRN